MECTYQRGQRAIAPPPEARGRRHGTQETRAIHSPQEPRKPVGAHSSTIGTPTAAEGSGRPRTEPPQSRSKGPGNPGQQETSPARGQPPVQAGVRAPGPQVPKNRPTHRRAHPPRRRSPSHPGPQPPGEQIDTHTRTSSPAQEPQGVHTLGTLWRTQERPPGSSRVARHKNAQTQNSFIFPARLLTPPRRIQQGRYMNDIQSQIERRLKFKAQDEQNRHLMECLDQIQLNQEIASEKAQQLQQKREKTEHYKRALDTQVEDKKCTEPPHCHPDKSTFSRCETAACDAESRERAQKVFQVNFSAANQRKKELHNHQAQLEKEKEMLRHNKMDFLCRLILDRIKRFERMRDISKSLEQEWNFSVKHKHKQEEDERRFLRSASQLLVDKLAEYRRCKCKRRTTNCGETNIWKDSHYRSGSKFMI